jgi:glycosyltransferase involved in cell wall biosynthesis
MSNNLELSFIIPALNEERNIQRTINAIKKAVGNQSHEIIVSDNGSEDRTAEMARDSGARVISDGEATIASLRNAGAKVATGSLLVFIDADVQLEADWLRALKQEMIIWPADNLIVTGNTCLVPSGSSFIQRNWFAKLTKTATNYINSGHLITSREMFDRIGGFNENLKTAEDYDFCQRAKDNGGQLVKAMSLKAYHHGYPRTLWAFCAREAWHGREDFLSLEKLIKSKTAIASIINALLLSGSLITYLTSQNTILALNFFFGSVTLCLLLTDLKFGKDSPINFLKTTLCFELYLLSRAFSIFYRQIRPSQRR